MISICMIVKNEIDVFERCINSIKEKLGKLANEIIVVDSGSTDGTREKALELGCKVFDFKWSDDFAKARNFCAEHSSNDWILVIDADEYISKVNINNLKKVINNNDIRNRGFIKIININENNEIIESFDTARIYNKKMYKYNRAIHEYIGTDKGESGVGCDVLVDLELMHTGYTQTAYQNKGKLERNINIINKVLEQGEDFYLTLHLGKIYAEKNEYDKCIEQYEKIIFNDKCFNEFFYEEAVVDYLGVLIKLKQYNVAIICEKFWDKCCHRDDYLYLMGDVYFNNNMLEKCVDCYLLSLNVENKIIDSAYSCYSLGVIFESLGFKEESIYYFEQCKDFKNAKDKIEKLKNS